MAIYSFQTGEHWQDAILKIIKTHEGNPITLRHIYSMMKNHPLVTKDHLKPWREGGQPKYQCWIRRCLTSLVREEKICRVSSGVYKYAGG